MTNSKRDELKKEIDRGIADIEAGNVTDGRDVLERLRKQTM